jgi:GTP-binding protein
LLPIVAVVGRPNVGKSALFNRLIGENKSIVEDQPGVTRDRIYAECDWGGRDFLMVDTGGIIPETAEGPTLEASILEQARVAVEESSVVVFVLDAMAGIHALDQGIAEMLRRSGRPVLIAANKVDNVQRENEVYEFHALALGEPWPVSALHGLGTGELLDEIVKRLPPPVEIEENPDIKLALVGRPNVGKSSLVNALLGEERVIVDSAPGTTRDAVDTPLTWRGEHFTLIDTAGMRRPARVDEKVEYYSGVRSLRAIRRCDIVCLVVDATEGLQQQDKRIAGHAQEAKRAIMVIVNKWDLVRAQNPGREAQMEKEIGKRLAQELNFMSWAPVIFVSAKTGEGLDQIFELAKEVMGEFTRRVDTSTLNKVVQEATMMRPPPTFKGQQLKVFYVHQKDVKPPAFVFRVNSPKLLHFSYRRYLENHIRRAFGLMGTPIELILKQ